MEIYVVLSAYHWEEESTEIEGIFMSKQKADTKSKELESEDVYSWVEAHILNED